MAAVFIEVTSRLNSKTMVVNTNKIVKVADDGTGAILMVEGLRGLEEHKLTETYAAIKTALGV